jgi:hypothetical protein
MTEDLAFPTPNPWARDNPDQQQTDAARAGVPDRLFDVAFDAVKTRLAVHGLTDRDMRVAGYALAAVLADLRDRVTALRAEDPHNQPVRDAYDAVLDLFDWGEGQP